VVRESPVSDPSTDDRGDDEVAPDTELNAVKRE
jgi:hypothetical protein